MRHTDSDELFPHPRRGRRRTFGDAVGPGFVPDLDEGEPRRGRSGRRGHGPRGGPGFGPGFGGHGRGSGGPRGRRGRPRGDVRAAILLLLEEGPRHGYQLIQEIAERSGGAWTPSAGSVYPTLQVLEDEGLITIEPVEGRKTASLTEAGGAHVAEHREQLGTPWQLDAPDDASPFALREALGGLVEASKQVSRVGTSEQQQRAALALTQARTAIYRILAEGADADD